MWRTSAEVKAGSARLSQISLLGRRDIRRLDALSAMTVNETNQPDEDEQKDARRNQQIPREAGEGVLVLNRIGFNLLQRQRRVFTGGDGARGDQFVFRRSVVFRIEGQDAHDVAGVNRCTEFARPLNRGNLIEILAQQVDGFFSADDGHVLRFVNGTDAQRQFAVLGVVGRKARDVDYAGILRIERFRTDGLNLRKAVFKQTLGVLVAARIAVVEDDRNQIDAVFRQIGRASCRERV